MTYNGTYFGSHFGTYFGGVTSSVEELPHPGQGGGSRTQRRGTVWINRGFKEARELISLADEKPIARLKAVESAIKAIDPIIVAEKAELIASRTQALRLEIERLKLEIERIAEWRMQLAIAAMMIEFRTLLDALEAIALDDEEALLVMLLM